MASKLTKFRITSWAMELLAQERTETGTSGSEKKNSAFAISRLKCSEEVRQFLDWTANRATVMIRYPAVKKPMA